MVSTRDRTERIVSFCVINESEYSMGLRATQGFTGRRRLHYTEFEIGKSN